MKKKKILLIAGCSHTAGSEIDGTQDSFYNRQSSFGAKVARALGREPVNIAIPANTNVGIARSILNWFHKKYIGPESMDINVLCCWTEPTRLEVPSSIGQWRDYQSVCPAADWFDDTCCHNYRVINGWHGGDKEEQDNLKLWHRVLADQQPYLEYQSWNMILQIQFFLKMHNVPYMMSNAMPFYIHNNPSIKNLISMVDANKYYNLHNPDEAFYEKYKNLGYTNKLAKYWHHGERPHHLYAEELLAFNEEKKCLTK